MDAIIVDFLRSQVAIIDIIVLFFKNPFIVIQFEGHRDCAYHLDLPTLVDEDVVRVHAAYLFLQMFEFTACTDDIVEEIPYLSFQEILSEALPVGNLSPKNELIVVKAHLNEAKDTFTRPELPHIPTVSKEYLSGSIRTYLLSVSLIWFIDLTH